MWSQRTKSLTKSNVQRCRAASDTMRCQRGRRLLLSCAFLMMSHGEQDGLYSDTSAVSVLSSGDVPSEGSQDAPFMLVVRSHCAHWRDLPLAA